MPYVYKSASASLKFQISVFTVGPQNTCFNKLLQRGEWDESRGSIDMDTLPCQTDSWWEGAVYQTELSSLLSR